MVFLACFSSPDDFPHDVCALPSRWSFFFAKRRGVSLRFRAKGGNGASCLSVFSASRLCPISYPEPSNFFTAHARACAVKKLEGSGYEIGHNREAEKTERHDAPFPPLARNRRETPRRFAKKKDQRDGRAQTSWGKSSGLEKQARKTIKLVSKDYLSISEQGLKVRHSLSEDVKHKHGEVKNKRQERLRSSLA